MFALIIQNIFSFGFYAPDIVRAETLKIEVLIEGVDEEPRGKIIGEYGPFTKGIELWHYSGGYWGYKGLIINDKDLGSNIDDEEALEKAISEEIKFDYAIDSELYKKLIEEGDIKVVCSTTLKDEVTMENKSILDLFYGTPTIEIKNGKIYFSAKPKFHFYNRRYVNYQSIIGDKLNVIIPIVDPVYGYNTYAIWKRTKAVDWGGALGYFDKKDIFAEAPSDSGRISPAQIKNASGHLIDGFTFKTGETTRKSEESSVGYGTFKNGGAVGIHFDYPIKFTFYSAKEPRDFSVHFENIPQSAAKGDTITISAVVNSTFLNEETTNFTWEITPEKDRELDVVYIGKDGEVKSEGEISVFPEGDEKGDHIFYAIFTMPDCDVNVKFAVNEDGTNPEENDLENNVVSDTIEVVKSFDNLEVVNLPYYALSRDISFDLADGNEIKAELRLPRGSWDGNAKGELNVTNEDKDLLRKFEVKNNPKVDEDSETIIREPKINAQIQRSDFGDNPLEKKYLDLADPTKPIQRKASVTYEGNVKRNYTYTYYCDKEEDCAGHTRSLSTSAAFNRGNHEVQINTYVYNGKKDLNQKEYENKISNNYDTDLKARMLWTNNPIKFNVIRYMCDLDVNENPTVWKSVPGKYERQFVQQCSADVDWDVTRSMAQDYRQARDAASRMKYDSSLYDKAVFATDISMKDYDYPIKSGYYFNPTGTYTFEVTTVNYKNNQDDTREHKELVNALINSFRYESNLVYIDANNQAVNIANGPYTDPGVLTTKNNKGIGGEELITVLDRSKDSSRYKKVVEEIVHNSKMVDDENENGSHDYWKMSMEGYSLSGSLDSYNKYKYREYVAGGNVFKITETTKVTIIINKDNKKFYTHPKMADGEYYITVRLSDINLNGMSDVDYKSIKDALKGVVLESIKITVKGSIYDDIS